MKVWITKYALTQGIKENEANVCSDVSDEMIVVKGIGLYGYFHKPYWHTDKQEAIKHAESMRLKKIDSLKKQIAKLEKLKF